MKFETRAIHTGQSADPATGATIVPVYQTSTFTQQAIGKHHGYQYARSDNPTRAALEKCLASLEGGRHALAYASGMAAITGTMQLVSGGDHVVVSDDLYGGTYRLFSKILPNYGVRFDYADGTQPDLMRKAMTPQTRMVWIESPTNPMLRLIDIAACAQIAHAANALLVVDNTFATPYLQRPIELGADIVVHSMTKYIGGHSDLIGGAVVVRDDTLGDRLRFTQNATGGVPGPWDSFLALRGLKTLAVRMRAHCAHAAKVAHFLRGRREFSAVYYPGFEDHPHHQLARKQMSDFGGMVTVELAGGESAARKLCELTKIFTLAESLGGVESLIGYPWLMSHGAFEPQVKLEKGITQATVRLSVGLEDADDLIADLDQALAHCG
jgi:cystathionine beta-lyase/cystathionine gamma-synthase